MKIKYDPKYSPDPFPKHDAFYSEVKNVNWSVHYPPVEKLNFNGGHSQLMTYDTAMNYAEIFKADFIWKAKGFLKGIKIYI